MQEEQRLAASLSTTQSSSSPSSNDAPSSTLQVDMDKTVIRLNAVTTGRPLFIVHGAGGGVLVMQKMANKVNCPLYGVQDTADAPITGNLQRLSEFYLEKIKEVQPEGPYRIGGFSFGQSACILLSDRVRLRITRLSGTCVALTIAQILQKEGETVETLLMIDGSPTLFRRPKYVEQTKRRITDGTLRQDVRSFIHFSTSVLIILSTG